MLLAAPCAAQSPTAPLRRETVIARELDKLLEQNIPEFKDHYFSFIIGIDTSASFASSSLGFTRNAVDTFLREHVVPGEAVGVFQFGANPHPLNGGAFFLIPPTVAGARAEIQNVTNDIQKWIMRNNERGTDVNHALSYALRMASKAPRRNRLVLLFTDQYGEVSQWSSNPKNLKTLQRQIKGFGRRDSSERLTDGVYVRYTYIVRDDERIVPPKNEKLPGGPNLRQEIAYVVNPPSKTPQAVGEEPPPSAGFTLRPGTVPAIVATVLLVGGVLGTLLFALTRPIPVTLSSESEVSAWIPLNRPFTIGGHHTEAGRGFSTPYLKEPIARIVHSFPRRLTVSRLKSNIPCRMVLAGGHEVQEDPSPLVDKADIYWTDMQTGRFCSIRVKMGAQQPLQEDEPDDDDDD